MQLGNYTLEEKLGEGGMGVVWRAADTSLDRDVAIKILPDDLAGDSVFLARFEREAKLLASLNHPNIAGIPEIGEAEVEGEELRFLVMELVIGETLASILDRTGPLEPLAAAHVLRQILAAAGAAVDRRERDLLAGHQRGLHEPLRRIAQRRPRHARHPLHL